MFPLIHPFHALNSDDKSWRRKKTCIQTDNRTRLLFIFMAWFSCIVSQSTRNSLFLQIIYSAAVVWASPRTQRIYSNPVRISPDTLGPPNERGFLPCPLLFVRGDRHTDNGVTSPPGGGDTSEWFVVGEDWWTAVATLFLCEINSTCRSVLYEWWRPPQAIHTAAQRRGPRAPTAPTWQE